MKPMKMTTPFVIEIINQDIKNRVNLLMLQSSHFIINTDFFYGKINSRIKHIYVMGEILKTNTHRK